MKCSEFGVQTYCYVDLERLLLCLDRKCDNRVYYLSNDDTVNPVLPTCIAAFCPYIESSHDRKRRPCNNYARLGLLVQVRMEIMQSLRVSIIRIVTLR